VIELPIWKMVREKINESGELPDGFHVRMLIYSEVGAVRWRAYISGPNGATNWLEIEKIPKETLRSLK